MEFHFILNKPAVPGNIGSSARALKTMGFDKLRLVNACNHQADEARWMAHASFDILESAQIFSSLVDATKDLDFLVATSAKKRSVKQDYFKIQHLPNFIQNKKNSISKVGILFGSEEHGLSNDELIMCDIVAYIPMKTVYPSLNLSHAVMLFAFYLSGISDENQHLPGKTDEGSYKQLKEKSSVLLQKIGLDNNPNLYYRIRERMAQLKDDDIHLFLSFFKYVDQWMLDRD